MIVRLKRRFQPATIFVSHSVVAVMVSPLMNRWMMNFAKSRRLYVFNNHAWTQDDIQALEQRIRQ